jgi:hypothetical protein
MNKGNAEKLAILVTGAREYYNKKIILETLKKYKDDNVVLIHGNCQGVDKLAAEVGKGLGFEIECCPADWKKYGRAAGPIRNKEMIELLLNYKNRIMFAFHENIELSKGTKNCVNQAKKLGIIAKVIKE